MNRRDKLLQLASTVYGMLPYTDDELDEVSFALMSDTQLVQFIYRVSDLNDLLCLVYQPGFRIIVDWRTYSAVLKPLS